MNLTPNNMPQITGLRGAALGGILGITVWQIYSASLISLGFSYGLVALVVYTAFCFFGGMAIERAAVTYLVKHSAE